MPPVITSLSAPAVRGDTVRAVGDGFGFVSSVVLKETSTHEQTPTSFQVDNGSSIHFTIPRALLDGTYAVELGTLFGELPYTSTLTFTLPDDAPITPAPGAFQANPIPDYSSPAMDVIRARARLELGDYSEQFVASVPGDGVAKRFDLPAEVIGSLTVVLNHNNTATTLVADTDYTLDAQEGVIDLVNPPVDGDTLITMGSNFQFFTDEELDAFILSAALKHTHNAQEETVSRDINGFKHYDITQRTVDTLPPVEYHPVALLASIEALWVMISDASFDMSVTTAEGTSLNREERYQNMLGLVTAKQSQYDYLAANLGVGLGRIEVMTMRRVSRTTNRLVPVYVDREYDDRGFPLRVYQPVDQGVTGAGTVAPDPFNVGNGVFWP